ncbi:MAG: DNA repair protein RadC [Caldisericota bacterium]|nr:DNA repair protein RadC [Caldisericota bacterium]
MEKDGYEQALAYLVQKAAYPMWSKNGVWFRDADGSRVEEPQSADLATVLALSGKERCDVVRKEIRVRVERERTYVPIKQWAVEERPREQLVRYGPDAMSNARLLAILFRTGSHQRSAEELGRELFNRFGSWNALDQASVEDICEVYGIGLAKAVELKAAIEIGKRLQQGGASAMKRVTGAEDAIDYVCDRYVPQLRDAGKEFFYVVLLDIRNKVIRDAEVSRGSISASVVDPADIVREACVHHASRVVLVHNHPSGETDPSKEDIDTTNKITQALKYVGVRVLDHIIVGRTRQDYFSFARAGMV